MNRCWITKDRYYHVSVNRDLFGRWSMVKSWGGRHNRLGGSESVPIDHYEDSLGMVQAIERQRARRGYSEVKH